MTRPRIVVLGAGGQVGRALAATLPALGEVVPTGRAELDLADLEAIAPALRALRPSMIVNAAAYTAVDRAESEPALAMRVNGEAVGEIGRVAAELGAPVVHFSTDYVFDGASARPYVEGDSPAPLNVYGRSKRAGEEALASSGAAYLCVRTSWVWDREGSNFVRTMRRLARERDELRVVADQHGAPTYAPSLAAALTTVLRALLGDPAGSEAAFRARGGLLHLRGSGETTWHGFAESILALDPERDAIKARRVVPVPTAEYPTPARRPLHAVLDCSLAVSRFGVRLPHWRDDLEAALA